MIVTPEVTTRMEVSTVVNIAELRAELARKQLTQKQLAKLIGMSEQTLSRRMKTRVFGSDEIEKIIRVLDLKDPVGIFFSCE